MESILDHPVVSTRYFFPRREPLHGAFMVECGAFRLGCYLNAPHTDAKTLVYFHGNGEVVAESATLLAEPFSALGLNAFFAEYRGYGSSTGRPALVSMLEDVPCMIRALGLPEDQIILFGRSVGSIYALHATRHFPNVAGLVIESGIADPLERILLRVEPRELGVTADELGAEVGKHLNHRELLETFRRPALFLHTRHDGLIGVHHAEQMHAWSAGPKEIVIFERGDHNSILHANFQTYMNHLKQFVDSLP